MSWINMPVDKRYHQEWSSISRHVRELFNNHCVRCGKNCCSPENHQDHLQVHHIDENPGNNTIENLIPLCSVCHLQVEKEARLHAPFQERQAELFSETYMTTMLAMRENGLKNYGGLQKTKTTQMSPEEFEQFENDLDL